MALPVKIVSCFGVPEYWSIGVLEKAKTQISALIISLYHYSITPTLHYSSRLTHRGKNLKAPSGGSSKPSHEARILYFPAILPVAFAISHVFQRVNFMVDFMAQALGYEALARGLLMGPLSPAKILT